METIGTERVVRINIMMDRTGLQKCTSEEEDRLPAALKSLMKRNCRLEDVITQSMQSTLFQILECPYQGLAHDLYIEGKVLELIAHKMDQFESESRHLPKQSKIKTDDIDRVRRAARMLTKNLENAPNLTELARAVGMCRSKLHQCFSKIYGITPFDYLRNRRLEAAEVLLREGKKNVTEAAYEVGYSSRSHFSREFKKYFGCLPSNYSQRQSF